MSRSAWHRRTVLAALAVLGVAVLALVGAAAWVANANLADAVSRLASDALGRRVSVGALELGWQDGPTLELRDLAIANADWSETPQMVTVGTVSAAVDGAALLQGVLRYDRLRVADTRIVLERDAEGTGNWEFDGVASGGAIGDIVLVPKNRTQFPTLIDAVLQEMLVTYRTSSGAIIEIALDEVAIRTPGDDQPVAIAASGTYNGVAARLSATGASFDAFRNASRRYKLPFSIETGTTTARFDGSLADPLDFDGVAGTLAIEASSAMELAQMFRAGVEARFPLMIAGAMTREGDDWRLAEAGGAIAGNIFTGRLRLREGGRGAPDDVAAELDFAEFDTAPFLGDGVAADGGYGDLPLALAEAPGIHLDARLRADALVHEEIQLADAILDGRVEGRRITVEEFGFALAGGRMSVSGSARPAEGGGGTVELTAAATGIDAAAVAQSLGAAPGEVHGTLAAGATLDMTGDTVAEGLGASHGHAVIAMSDGRIARAVLETVASDLRSLFREPEGSARIECVLGILDVVDGIGRVRLLKLRTAEATLNGGGTIDLIDRHIDMTFKTARDSTGFFALDVPFRVHGPLADPIVEAADDGPETGASTPAGDALPDMLRRMARSSPCRG